MYYNNVSEGILLLALAAGYGVFYLAGRQGRGFLRGFGYCLAGIIVALSFVFLIDGLVGKARINKKMKEWKKFQQTLPGERDKPAPVLP